MTTNQYIQALINPENKDIGNIDQLKSIIDKYPYFQSARTIYLKKLKDLGNYKYNNELKITAAYTTDRSVLLDFISSLKHEKNKKKDKSKFSLNNFIASKKEKEIKKIEEELNIGQPIAFTKSEAFSFNKWLELSSKTPIIRDEQSVKDENVQSNKNEKDDIINRFITNNPKISRPNKNSSSDFKVTESQQNAQLMTETLAKVYLAQKKYDSAIQAYKILSLKYPEKSGFFADQIKRIKILQNNK
ncbi:hypothetical protein [Tenacibaculum sp. 190524A02b]|uniref:hypothetical protein n=1 Tax=Tenacibaculum vairaonense TaxID=3137860 RepID=UPI0031FB8A5C